MSYCYSFTTLQGLAADMKKEKYCKHWLGWCNHYDCHRNKLQEIYDLTIGRFFGIIYNIIYYNGDF